jgi:hypothetical protein
MMMEVNMHHATVFVLHSTVKLRYLSKLDSGLYLHLQ